MKILVDLRRQPDAERICMALADACKSLGHEVAFWSGQPKSDCDVAILWGSIHPKYAAIREHLKAVGAKAMFVQFGWRPKATTFQVDTTLADGLSEWASEPLEYEPGESAPSLNGEMLVALQDGMYIRSDPFSPHFNTSTDLIRHLIAHSQMPLRFRPHPLDPPTDEATAMVLASDNARWDESKTFTDALDGVCAVATIHSSTAVEALGQNLPVLCYGNAVYRHEGAVWCMDGSPLQTWCRTHQLRAAHCDLDTNAQAAMVQRLMARQWTVDDLPGRLETEIARVS